MADKEKKKKPKKKEDEGDAPKSPPDAQKSPTGSSRASRGSRKAKRTGSSVFSMFTQKQLAEFKEAFQLIDHDKDGILGKSDLAYIFDQVGRIASEKELQEMLSEAPGPINFTQFLQLFGSRMSGGEADDDEDVIKAFKTFDNGHGKIDGEKLKRSLMTWGDKFSIKEVNEAYDNMFIDDKGFIDTESLINMLLGKGDDEEES